MSKEVAKTEQPEGLATIEELAMKRNSARFLAEVERQFVAEVGSERMFTPLEKRLAQHMYLAVDQSLKTAEADRVRKNKGGAEYAWTTIDRQKLALDTVHRISLGLDALIPNHIWPVMYFNGAKKMYDIDLRIGYVGRDYVARTHALDSPVAIVYELVHETDTFRALPRSSTREVEGYEFEINNPFDRGGIVGGFGYVVHDDERKNRLILVTQRDFERSKKASKSTFWSDNDVEMHLKTVFHRVAAKIPMDPEKVNASAYAAVMTEEGDPVDVAHRTVDAAVAKTANKQLMDVEAAPKRVKAEVVEAEPETVPAGGLFDDTADGEDIEAPF